MPSRVYWLEEPTIMVAEYSGEVTTEDLDHALVACLEYLENYTIYFMVDMTTVEKMPTNVLKMATLSQLVNHERARWFAFVKPNILVKFAMQVMHRNFARTFEEKDEALAFLHERIDDEGGQSLAN